MPPAIAAAWLATPAAHFRLKYSSPSPYYHSIRTAPSITSLLPIQRRLSCHVSITNDPSPSSSSSFSEMIGRKVRVKVPLKVFHVARSPELDLNGMVGVVKQYVGVWKGKRITPNLPFKAEFLLPVEDQIKPVKFIAHLREGFLSLLIYTRKYKQTAYKQKISKDSKCYNCERKQAQLKKKEGKSLIQI